MKNTKNIPTPIVCVDANLDYLWHLQRQMKAHLKVIHTAWKSSAALRQKANEDGVPGDASAFYGPVFDLKEDAALLKATADNIKEFADVLLAHNPEEWQ